MATPNYLTSSLARRYYRQMKAGLRSGGQPSSVGSGMPLRSQMGALAPTPNAEVAKAKENQSGWDRTVAGGLNILDKTLFQPGYAVAQTIAETADAAQEAIQDRDLLGMADAATIGLVRRFPGNFYGGNDKQNVSDLFRGKTFRTEGENDSVTVPNGFLEENENDNWAQRLGKGVAGFGIDVATDPTTFIGAGLVGQSIKGVARAAQGTRAVQAIPGAVRAAEGAAKTGEAITKADNFVNDLPFRGARAIRDNIRAGRARKAEVPAPVAGSTQQVIEEAAPEAPIVAPEAAPEQDIQPFLSELLADPTPRTITAQRMLRDPETGEEIPWSSNEARKRQKPEYDFSSVLDDAGRFATPYKENVRIKEVPEEVIEQPNLVAQLLNDVDNAKTAQAKAAAKDEITQDLTPVKPPTKEEVRAWVESNPDAKVTVEMPYGQGTRPTTKTVKEWRERLGSKANPLAQKGAQAVNKALAEAGRSGAASRSVPGSAPVRPVERRSPKAGTPAGVNGTDYTEDDIRQFLLAEPGYAGGVDKISPARIPMINEDFLRANGSWEYLMQYARDVAAEDPEDIGLLSLLEDIPRVMEQEGVKPSGSKAIPRTQTIKERSWVQKPKQQRERLRARYEQILEQEHFEYLYENQSSATMSNAEKVKDFRLRLANLKRGMGLQDVPRYEEFTRYQIVMDPEPITPSRRKAWALSDRPEDKFDEAVGTAKVSPDIMKEVDTSLPATRDRDAERIMSGSQLDQASRDAISRALGSDYIRGDATGQQWLVRNPEFVFESDIQKTARNSDAPGVGRGVNVEAYNAYAQSNMFRELLNAANDEIATNNIQFVRKGKKGGIDGYARAQYLREYIVPRLRDIENYLRSHGVEPIGGATKRGVPISLADTIDVLSLTPRGADFLDRRLFGGMWGIKPRGMTTDSPGTVYTTSLLRVMGAVVDSMDASLINAARKGTPDLYNAVRSALYNEVTGRAGLKVGDLKAILTADGEMPITTARRVKPRPGQPETPVSGSNEKGWAVDVTPEGKAYYGPHSTQIVKELEDVLFGDMKHMTAEGVPTMEQSLKNLEDAGYSPRDLAGGEIEALENGVMFIDKNGDNVRVAAHMEPDFTVAKALVENTQQRSADYGIRFGDNVRQLTERTMREVFDFLDTEPGVKAATDFFESPAKLVDETAKSRTIAPTKEERKASVQRVQEDIPGEAVSPVDMANMDSLRKTSKAIRAGDRAATNKAMDGYRKTVEEELDSLPQDLVLSVNKDAEVADITGVARRAGLWLTTHFVPSRVTNDAGQIMEVNSLHEGFLQSGSLGRNMSQQVRRDLNEINRMGSREEIQQAYAFLQRGAVGQVDPKIEAIAQRLGHTNSMFYDTASNTAGDTAGILQDFFNRGYNLDHVEAKMKAGHFGIPESQQFDWDAVRKIKDPSKKMEELHRQWKNLKIDDPLDYLARLDATVGNLAVDVSVSQKSFAKLQELNLMSEKPRPGYVKLGDRETNIITRYFPGDVDNLYVDRRVVTWVKKLDELMSASTNLNGGIGRFINGVYDPLFGMWKSGMTIWRPGHHVRNLVGDVSLSFLMDGVKNPKYYYRAVRFLSERKKYDQVDMLRMLQGLPSGKVQEAQGTIKANLGRGNVEVPEDEFYEAMFSRGIIKDFVQQEDIIESNQVARPIAEAQKRMQIFGGRARQAVGSLSEARDDLVRVAHALHLMENPWQISQGGRKSYKSLDEMYDAVAAQVNRVHPDGTDLTGTERNIARRLFSFYSWTRKAIPLIVESMIMHPGRVTMYPKFMYSMAQAQGIDLESMSDPFPEDQMWPSWLTSKTTGPLWQTDDGSYFGINPGATDQDVISDFFSPGAGAGIIDSLTPALKLPFELKSGETLGAGVQTPGQDPMQYVGSQIPGISHVQQLTGYDPIGSAGTLVQGEGLDPLTSVTKGNRENFEMHRFINFLLGTGITDMTTPSIINSAEIEKRDRS